MHAPLYGSVARIVRAKVLKARREALNLNEGDILAPIAKTDKELELEAQERAGGVVLMGRPTMKEYLAGLKAGWGQGVGEWVWEDSVKGTLSDEPFADPVPAPVVEDVAAAAAAPAPEGAAVEASAVPAVPAGGVQHVGLPGPGQKLALPPVEDDEPQHSKRSWFGGLFGHGGKKAPQPQQAPNAEPAQPAKFEIPPNWHAAPAQLPPHAPVLLVDWCNHLGFKQIPYMIYDFFTEHKRVKAGAEAAYALITEQTRPFRGPEAPAAAAVDAPAAAEAEAAAGEASADAPAGPQGGDLDFDRAFEKFYKKDYAKLPEEVAKERDTYYGTKLPPRVEAARAFARGEREITAEEKRSDKPVETVQALREQRAKKELRWEGNLEGWDIVKPQTPVAWDDRFAGWLSVYAADPQSLESVMRVPEKNGESRLE